MTTEQDPETPQPTPRERFFQALERCVRLWLCSIGLAVVPVLLGISPSLLVVVALLGVIWVPLVTLVLWGQWLDALIGGPPDRGEGPW